MLTSETNNKILLEQQLNGEETLASVEKRNFQKKSKFIARKFMKIAAIQMNPILKLSKIEKEKRREKKKIQLNKFVIKYSLHKTRHFVCCWLGEGWLEGEGVWLEGMVIRKKILEMKNIFWEFFGCDFLLHVQCHFHLIIIKSMGTPQPSKNSEHRQYDLVECSFRF